MIAVDDYRELVRANNLAAHDVHIASFVYLRRIVERKVNAAANRRLESDASRDHAGWLTKRFGEKVDDLSGYLPTFLVENKASLYPILSKGIHELSEEECGRLFQIVRLGVEAILDEEVAEKQRQKRAEQAKRALSAAKAST